MMPPRTSLSCDLHEVSTACVLLPAGTAGPVHGVIEPTKYFHLTSELITFPRDCIFPFLQRHCVCFKVAGTVVFVNRFWTEPIKWLGKKMTMMFLPSVSMIISIKHWRSSSQIRIGRRIVTQRRKQGSTEQHWKTVSVFGHLHFSGLERTHAQAVKLALPRGYALTRLLKTANAGQPSCAWTGQLWCQKRSDALCQQLLLGCLSDCGEEQSCGWSVSLSVGQVCCSGEYQQLYLLGSIFITQVLDQKYFWRRHRVFFPVISQPLQWSAECVLISLTFNIIFQSRQHFLP